MKTKIGKKENMTLEIQLDIFESDEANLLWNELAKVKASSDNVRRGLFARHNEMAKELASLKQRMEIMENNVYANDWDRENEMIFELAN